MINLLFTLKLLILWKLMIRQVNLFIKFLIL
nr:MAG TPA: hypothetical protein [Caudoviricetes sp.]DAS12178.1 MAG TPA: hypothetical protein [Caudoviricetes sp.]